MVDMEKKDEISEKELHSATEGVVVFIDCCESKDLTIQTFSSVMVTSSSTGRFPLAVWISTWNC